MGQAVVVGGGIGGLSAAIGLRRAGWAVTVLERAPGFAEIGAGITLWPNALRALDELGVDTCLPVPHGVGGLRNRRGRWLMRWESDRFTRLLDRPLLPVHRARLLDLLREAVPEGSLRAGIEVTEVTEDGEVRWDGGTLRADLVVAADGIHSALRDRLWPGHPAPAYSGSTAFRAVVPGDPRRTAPVTTLAPGTEFGMVPLTGGDLYWYAAVNAPENAELGEPKTFLRKRFRDWYAEVRELVERTPAERILRHDLYWLRTPLPGYVRGRVALLGDAAHAMTPFLGQGGCQAIEDAVVLAAAVADTGDVSAALARYDRERRPRSQAIARGSARMGRTGAQLTNPVAVAVRDTVARLLPARLGLRASAAVADWTPPVISSPTSTR